MEPSNTISFSSEPDQLKSSFFILLFLLQQVSLEMSVTHNSSLQMVVFLQTLVNNLSKEENQQFEDWNLNFIKQTQGTAADVQIILSCSRLSFKRHQEIIRSKGWIGQQSALISSFTSDNSNLSGFQPNSDLEESVKSNTNRQGNHEQSKGGEVPNLDTSTKDNSDFDSNCKDQMTVESGGSVSRQQAKTGEISTQNPSQTADANSFSRKLSNATSLCGEEHPNQNPFSKSLVKIKEVKSRPKIDEARLMLSSLSKFLIFLNKNVFLLSKNDQISESVIIELERVYQFKFAMKVPDFNKTSLDRTIMDLKKDFEDDIQVRHQFKYE